MEIKPIAAIGVGILLVGGFAWAGISNNNTQEAVNDLANLNNVLSNAVISNSNLESDISILNEEISSLGLQFTSLEEASEAQAAADAQVIADYEAELLALQEEIDTEAEEEIVTGYEPDEFGLAQTVVEVITENDYDKLLDSEVEFDNDDYDFEEVLSYTVTSDINGDDYNENTYLVVEENGFEYKLVFDNDLDTSLISEDETLKISFLGKDIEITSWDVDKISMEVGDEYLMNINDVIIVNNKEITLRICGEDFVYLSVGDESEKISEDETEEVNGLNIKLDFSAEGAMANLIISDADIETSIENGDEFSDDSIWEYIIDSDYIGIKLVEDFDDIDDDSDYKALSTGESIMLPNDYLGLTYNGLSELDYYNVAFSEKDGYVKIKGDFVSGLDDYDLIYVNSTGFYDRDYVLITDSEVEIDNTDSLIKLNNNTLVINDVVLNLDFSDATVNTNSVLNKDDNYRSAYGIIVESPEDNMEDEDFKISVPEEETEVSVTVN